MRIASKSFDSNIQGIYNHAEGVDGRTWYAPGRITGECVWLRGMVSNFASYNAFPLTSDIADNVSRGDFYCRIYFIVHAHPGANGLRFFSCNGADGDAFFLTFESNGTINCWNKGSAAKELMGSIGGYALNEWHYLWIHVFFRSHYCRQSWPNNITMGNIEMFLYKSSGVYVDDRSGDNRLDGKNRLYTVSPNNSGLDYWTGGSGTCGAGGGGGTGGKTSRFGFGPLSQCLETDGGSVKLDDFAADDASYPNRGWVSTVLPIGNGQFQQWTQPDWRNAAQVPPSYLQTGASGVISNTNVTANLRNTVAMQPLASLGVTGPIKAVNIAVLGTSARANWALLYIRNGNVMVGSPPAPSQSFGYIQGPKSCGTSDNGWYIAGDASPADTFEVGVQDGNSGLAGTTSFDSVVMYVDHESTDPINPLRVRPSGDLQLYFGHYTGNGTVQDITIPFQPTFLLIKPDSGGSGIIWADGFGDNGGFPIHLTSSISTGAGLVRVNPTGFTVWNAQTNINASGINCRFIAISDPRNRMILASNVNYNPNVSSTLDNVDVALDDPNFIIEALMWFGNNAQTSFTSHYYRGPAQTGAGDSSTVFLNDGNADTADAIQSIGTGTFQVGKLAMHINAVREQYVAWRTANVFNAAKAMMQIGFYTGDGTNPRTISFTKPLNGAGLVVVIPAATNAKAYRWGDQPVGDQQDRFWAGDVVFNGAQASVIAFDQNGFQVRTTGQTNLNFSGTKYNYIAFGGGPNTIVDPDEVVMPPSSTIGLLWVEFLDALNGLYIWSKHPLPDPLTYYGGYKEPRVTRWGLFQRALSDRNGVYESMDASWEQDDSDGLVRGMLADFERKYVVGRPVTFRMISDPDRRLLKTPLTLMKSIVRSYDPGVDRHIQFNVQDIFADKFASQNTEDQIPQRRITVADFPNANATYQNANQGDIQVAAVGKPVPIIYGAITDRQFVDQVVTGSSGASVLPYDPNIAKIPEHIANGVADGLGVFAGARANFVVTAIIGGIEGPIKSFFGIATVDSGVSVRVSWDGISGADSYRVYMYDGHGFDPHGPTYDSVRVRYQAHDNSTMDGAYGRQFGILWHGYSDGTDYLGGATSTVIQVDAGDGQCPGIYVGKSTIGGVDYHTWVIAGHACKEVEEIYIDNDPINIQTDATQAGSGGIWLVPGYAGWTAAISASKFIDINGNRYCVVYGKVGQANPDRAAGIVEPSGDMGVGSVPISFNVKGIEANADGNGTLITDAISAYRHCVQNWIFGNYRSGPWLASPTFADDPSLAQINDDSFTIASGIAAERVAGGYAVAGIIGAGDEFLTVRELIARWNQSCDVDCSFNRKGQFFVSMERESMDILNASASFTEISDIHETSLKVNFKFEEHFNVQPYQHTQDYLSRAEGGWRLVDEGKDDDSIARYNNQRKVAPMLLLYFIRGLNRPTDWSGYSQGTATAADIIGRRLRRTRNPPAYATFKLGLRALNFEVGDIVKVTHRNGIGKTGWVDEAIRVTRFSIDPEEYEIEVTGYDIQVLYDVGFVLGDETVLPASWVDATTAQRLYGFLADELTEKFSTGEPIKRLS